VAVTAEPTLDAQKLRADFPILQQEINGKPLAYLDSAVTAQKPRQMLEAMTQVPHVLQTPSPDVLLGGFHPPRRELTSANRRLAAQWNKRTRPSKSPTQSLRWADTRSHSCAGTAESYSRQLTRLKAMC